MSSLPPPPRAPAPPAPDLPGAEGPALPGRRPSGRGGWPAWMSWVGLVSGYVTTVIGTILVLAVAGAAGAPVKSDDLPPGLGIALTVLQNIALCTAAYFLARTISRPRAQDFGLRVPRRLKHALRVLLGVWGVFFVLSAMWSLALNLHEKSDLPGKLGADLSTLNLLVVTLLVCAIAPVGEEFFFRGFFFGALRNWRGPWPAAIITGLVFGAVHLGSAPVGQLVPLAIFGVGLCLLYHWTGSLLPSIALHAVNNAIAFGAGEEHWRWWIVLLAMAGAVLTSLAFATAIRRLIGSGSRGGRGAAPAPAI